MQMANCVKRDYLTILTSNYSKLTILTSILTKHDYLT